MIKSARHSRIGMETDTVMYTALLGLCHSRIGMETDTVMYTALLGLCHSRNVLAGISIFQHGITDQARSFLAKDNAA